MTRNLKTLLAVAIALAAFGALSSTAAQAHTPTGFHCSVELCLATLKPDGASGTATAHHVFVVKNSIGESVSFTCRTLSGEGSSSKTSEELTVTNLVYSTCTANGQAVTVRTNSCDYLVTAAGEVTVKGCVAGKPIEAEITGTGCIATVGNQGPLKGITYHNIGEEAADTTEITASAKVPGIAVTLDNSAGGKCEINETKTPITSEYTTGNTLVTSETAPDDPMAGAWSENGFHCSVEPCLATLKPDGSVPSATAHHVFVVKNSIGESVSFTCRTLSGEGSSSKTSEELTVTKLVYSTCTANGQPATVRMNSCDYLFTSAGEVTVKGCVAGKPIEAEITGTGCIATVGNQGPLKGISYHNIGEEAADSTEITASAKVPGIAVTLDNSAGGKCEINETKTPITSEYTTGNTLVTSETAPDDPMAGAWSENGFHCSVEPCLATLKPDGSVPSATAHHVFVVKNSIGESVSFTCRTLSGEGSSSKTSEELTVTKLVYSTCTANGQPATVRMNSCDYLFTSAGEVTVKGCVAGKPIEAEITGTGCIATVGNQGPLKGISYHNIGEEAADSTEITASAKVPGIAVTLDNSAGGKCEINETKTPITSEYTTGNTLVTSETAPDDPMAGAWWTATVA